MLGDVLLITELHINAAEKIYEELIEKFNSRKKGHRFMVAISGESGAGKSELSHSLALLLKKKGLRVKILHTDNYYKVAPNLRNEWRKQRGIKYVGTTEYDWRLLNRNIREFKEGSEALMPCVDIVSKQVDKLITNFADIDILVIDGLYAIKIKGVDLRVYIDLTYHETKKNQGHRRKEDNDDFRFQVLEMEHKSLLELKPKADLIVNKNYEVEKAPGINNA